MGAANSGHTTRVVPPRVARSPWPGTDAEIPATTAYGSTTPPAAAAVTGPTAADSSRMLLCSTGRLLETVRGDHEAVTGNDIDASCFVTYCADTLT